MGTMAGHKEEKREGWCPLGFGKEKERERCFSGGEKRAWCHAMVCMPMW
jgi:hypothetical protein